MRTIDLSPSLRTGMRGVEFETARTNERDGWNARTLHPCSHTGTPTTAPLKIEGGDSGSCRGITIKGGPIP